MARLPRISLRARFVFPVVGPPQEDAVVTIDSGKIVAVHRHGAVSSDCQMVDLGNVAILPGLVNAHTHLEFSHLDQPLGRPGIPFPDWIREVIRERGSRSQHNADIVIQGLKESLRHGVTTLGEIAAPKWSQTPFERDGLEATVFLELIGLPPQRARSMQAVAAEHLADRQCGWRLGLSPHAPYSVHPELFAAAVDLAAHAGVPLALHLAEFPEELELLAQGTGTLKDLLVDLGAWDESAIPRASRPLDYLRRMSGGPRSLVIHGNYLDAEEIALLAAHRDLMTVVYCPRTHSYFGHSRYPLARMLAAGVAVALGTDSRASNPDLSLLAEMRHAARFHTGVQPSTIVEMATLNAARALGREDRCGSIEPGKAADLAIVALAERPAGDPHELLLDSDRPVVAAWKGGQVAWSSLAPLSKS